MVRREVWVWSDPDVCRKTLCTPKSPALPLTHALYVWAVLWIHQSNICRQQRGLGDDLLHEFTCHLEWGSRRAKASAAGITKRLQISLGTISLPYLCRQLEVAAVLLCVCTAFQWLHIFPKHSVRDWPNGYYYNLYVQECVHDMHSTYAVISFFFSLVQFYVFFFIFPHPMFFGAYISAGSCGAIPHQQRGKVDLRVQFSRSRTLSLAAAF